MIIDNVEVTVQEIEDIERFNYLNRLIENGEDDIEDYYEAVGLKKKIDRNEKE